jgi:hypothetical protein
MIMSETHAIYKLLSSTGINANSSNRRISIKPTNMNVFRINDLLERISPEISTTDVLRRIAQTPKEETRLDATHLPTIDELAGIEEEKIRKEYALHNAVEGLKAIVNNPNVRMSFPGLKNGKIDRSIPDAEGRFNESRQNYVNQARADAHQYLFPNSKPAGNKPDAEIIDSEFVNDK